ncbi:hypothetical protein ACQJBY_069379 [Aegilops geniculata]
MGSSDRGSGHARGDQHQTIATAEYAVNGQRQCRNRPAGRRRTDEGYCQEEAAADGGGRGLEDAAAGGAVAAGGRGSQRIKGGVGQAAGGDRRTGPAWERPPAESSGTCES